jgi:hypothetical protein
MLSRCVSTVLSICASGLGEGKGQYVSASFNLMKGEFDDQLKWPFKVSLQIKLANKDHSKDSKISVVHFSDTSSAGNKVTTGDRSTNTFGIAKFLSHESVPNFIQNDSLKFQVSMENI